ncbi:ent-kaurenoic acid oxidase 1-like [Neltuma alba]|uniref:ent-kaurenoic acid oxidase 1-like n=1 Tax=Neltuma alba TaxID=207710 RepID=UPI0010A441AD|nr:ent-kaurenoic acid oxidase 1-like [Prosopis alba]
MEMWVIVVGLCVGVLGLRWILRNVNGWLYESKHRHLRLPPGHFGWPFLGNMLAFLAAFKSTNPDSFVHSLVSRYGNTGIYKAMMFGEPSVIVTTPEGCRRVLTDDEKFTTGWPYSTVELMGRKSFIIMPYEEHKRLRRLTSASVNGLEALSLYLTYIEENVMSSLEKWTTMGEIEFLTQIRKLTFRIITHIFLGAASNSVVEALEKEYTTLNYGVRAMAINIPGFAYHSALKARKKLVSVFQAVVDERRKQEKEEGFRKTKDMMDALMNVEDENNGGKLSDEEIIDIMLMYLNAGHESSGHVTMWATIFLQNHPKYFQMAKAEHEEIVKKRPPTQTRLTMKEVRQMDFTSKVIDETMRLVTFSLMVFREAKCDVTFNGYTIPKGWKVLTWFRSIHYDPEIYPNPREFNPLRWNVIRSAGEFLPFGAGSRLCPGNDLAKLEISVFLHHFLLNYQLEQRNPKCPVRYLPHTRPMDNCLARVKKVTA